MGTEERKAFLLLHPNRPKSANFVRNDYTGRELRIDTASIRHGLNGSLNRLLTNARLGANIGTIVKNAVPINALRNKASGVTGTYAMAAYTADRREREFVAIITVEQKTGDVADISAYDVTHSVSGRQKTRDAQVDTKSQGVYPSMNVSKIKIADFLNIVNSTHQSILPQDVLAAFKETRNPKGEYADKKRTAALLRLFGLTIASRELLRNGYIGSISYKGRGVNQRGEKFSDIVKLDDSRRLTAKLSPETRDANAEAAASGSADGRTESSAPTETEEAKVYSYDKLPGKARAFVDQAVNSAERKAGRAMSRLSFAAGL